jgi:peptidoglycan/LPS O-acetylase OafA/YrhL
MTSAASAYAPAPAATMPRLPMLDGWRALSILAVLAAHMLPLGPARLRINVSAGNAGMGLFFALSGFLIASGLAFHPSVRDFAIRRIA